jgi:hypothetical protein
MYERIRLAPLTHHWVYFKLHELEELKEGIVRASDEHGYWIEGGSLAQYLKSASPGADAASEFQFIEHKRIHWVQRMQAASDHNP